MKYSSYYFLVIFIVIDADIQQIDVQQDERVQLECILKSRIDIDAVDEFSFIDILTIFLFQTLWMRIRPPNNPDILTYRDSIVYGPDRFKLDQRHLSSNINPNGTFQDLYFLTLIIQRVDLDDQGRYICSKGRIVFAEYDLFIISKLNSRESFSG